MMIFLYIYLKLQLMKYFLHTHTHTDPGSATRWFVGKASSMLPHTQTHTQGFFSVQHAHVRACCQPTYALINTHTHTLRLVFVWMWHNLFIYWYTTWLLINDHSNNQSVNFNWLVRYWLINWLIISANRLWRQKWSDGLVCKSECHEQKQFKPAFWLNLTWAVLLPNMKESFLMFVGQECISSRVNTEDVTCGCGGCGAWRCCIQPHLTPPSPPDFQNKMHITAVSWLKWREIKRHVSKVI